MEEKKEMKGLWISKEIYDYDNLDWTSKVLLCEILSLSKLTDGCIASNQHFANKLKLTKSSISKRITQLKLLGYIHTENSFKGNLCVGRVITESTLFKNCGSSIEKGGSSLENRGSSIEKGGSSLENRGSSLENTNNTVNNSINNSINNSSNNSNINNVDFELASIEENLELTDIKNETLVEESKLASIKENEILTIPKIRERSDHILGMLESAIKNKTSGDYEYKINLEIMKIKKQDELFINCISFKNIYELMIKINYIPTDLSDAVHSHYVDLDEYLYDNM